MENKEAIKILKELAAQLPEENRENNVAAVKMAIDALKESTWYSPVKQPKEFEDVIVAYKGADGDIKVSSSFIINGEFDIESEGLKVLAWRKMPKPAVGRSNKYTIIYDAVIETDSVTRLLTEKKYEVEAATPKEAYEMFWKDLAGKALVLKNRMVEK